MALPIVPTTDPIPVVMRQEQEIQILDQQKESLLGELELQRKELATLQTQVQNFHMEAGAQKQQLSQREQELMGRLMEAQTDRDRLAEQMAMSEGILALERTKLNKLNDAHTDLLQNCQKMQQEACHHGGMAYEQRDIISRVEALAVEGRASQACLREAQNSRTQAEQEHHRFLSRTSELERQLHSRHLEIQKLRLQCSSLENEMIGAEKELSGARQEGEEQQRELEREFTDHRDRAMSLQAEREGLLTTHLQTDSEIKQARMEADNMAAERRLIEERITRARADKEELVQERARLKGVLRGADSEIPQLQQVMSRQTASVASLKGEGAEQLSTIQAKLAEVEGEKARVVEAIGECTSFIGPHNPDGLLQEAASLRQMIQGEVEARTRLQDEVSQLQTAITGLQTQAVAAKQAQELALQHQQQQQQQLAASPVRRSPSPQPRREAPRRTSGRRARSGSGSRLGIRRPWDDSRQAPVSIFTRGKGERPERPPSVSRAPPARVKPRWNISR